VFEESQVWVMVGVLVGAVAIIVTIGVMFNAYIIGRRLANVLADVEEIIHADLKGLEDKVESALTRIRAAEIKSNRD
jgi:hypothetical protein